MRSGSLMSSEEQTKGNGDPLLRRIDAIRRRVTMWRMGWGYLCLLLLIAGIVFLGVLLDHILTLQRPGRVVFFHTFVASALVTLLLATVYPLLRRVGRLYIARRIEDENPSLGNSLISYLQVREDPRVPMEAKVIMGRRAASRVRSFEPEHAVDFGAYLRVGIGLLAIVVLFVAYSLISPKSTAVSVSRLLHPRRDILPPTATRIVEVSPGPLYVTAGERPTVTVRIEGMRPEGVAVVWDGQSFEDRRVLLSEGEGGAWQGRFPAVLEDGAYYVVAGDTRSERYEVRALPRPVVERIELRLQPPGYTGLPATTVEAGDLEVVQGTRIGLTVRTSLAAAKGHVSFGSGRRVPLDPLPGETGLGGAFTAMRSDTWAVHFESITYPGGATFRNATPLEYRLTVGEDEAPTVRVEQPPDGVTVERDAVVRVVYTAQDDFGLRAVRLHHGVGGFYGKPAVIAQPAGPVLEGAVWEWDLSELTLSPGQTITYYLEAQDNRPDVPQTGRSEERRIVIAGQPEPPLSRQEEGATAHEPPERRPADQSERESAGERPSADRAGRGQEERTEGIDEEGAETAEQDRFETLRDYVRRLREEMGEPTDGGAGAPEAARDRAGRPSPAQREAETAPPGAASDSALQPRDAVAEPGERTAVGEAGGEAERSSDGPSAPGEGTEQAGARSEEGGGDQSSVTESGGTEGRSGNGQGQGAETGQPSPEGRSGERGEPGRGVEGDASRERGAGGAGAAPDGRTGAGAGAAGRTEGRTAEGVAGEAAGEAGSRSGAAPGGQAGAPGSAAGGAAGQGADGSGQTGQAGPGGTRSGRPGGAAAGAGGQGVQQLPPPGPPETALGDEGMSAAVEELERMLEQDELPNALLDELGMDREDLRELIKRFRERAAEGPDGAESDGARALGEPEGRVLPGAAAAADEMALRDALPAGEPDRLRSRFEGADEQLSTRYQEVVNQYYKALSEEP